MRGDSYRPVFSFKDLGNNYGRKAIRPPLISIINVEWAVRFKIYVILADCCVRRASKTRIFTYLKVQTSVK
jgi:hypothetical protein